MTTMVTFTRENIISMRHASQDMARTERLVEMIEAARTVARNIYNIVLDYAAYGPYNSYRYQITHPKYYTDGLFVMKVVDMLKKAFPDFDVLPEAVENSHKEVVMHSIVITW